MRKRHLPLFAVAVTLAVAVYSQPAKARPANGHDFLAGDCAFCHVTEGKGGTWAMTFPKADISARCVQCHNSCDNWTSHAGERKESAAMMKTLPLVGNGKIGCVTCHRTHGRSGENSPGEGRLRLSNLKRGLCLNCHREEGEGNPEARITVPPEAAVVYDARVPFIGRVENLAESYVSLKVNGAEFPLKVKEGIFHTRIRVEEGINRIELSYHGEPLWRGNVFRASGSDRAAYYGKVYSGHQTDTINECLGCHEQKDGLLQAGTPALPDLCYGCHTPFEEKRYLHGPLAVGECMSCHDPHGGAGPYHLRDGEASLCLGCHEEEEVLGHRGGREGVAGGSCSGCHDPHASDTRFLQREASLSVTGE